MTTPKKKRGRPLLKVNVTSIRKLASVGCTNEEIADILGCSSDTLTRNFAEPLKEARSNLRSTLRTCQVKLAVAGNATMQIWLGKQMLGQKDKHEVGNATDADGNAQAFKIEGTPQQNEQRVRELLAKANVTA